MGNYCDSCEKVTNSDHVKENNRVNDGFYPMFGLFGLEKRMTHVSLFNPPRYRYHPPSPQFLEKERNSAPRLVLEVRKGIHFDESDVSPLTVHVKLQPSLKRFSSAPSPPHNPRWYYLVYRSYQPGENDTEAVIHVLKGETTVASTAINLSQIANRYEIFWSTLSIQSNQIIEKRPRIEFRIFNLTNPSTFWREDCEGYQSALTTITKSTFT